MPQLGLVEGTEKGMSTRWVTHHLIRFGGSVDGGGSGGSAGGSSTSRTGNPVVALSVMDQKREFPNNCG